MKDCIFELEEVIVSSENTKILAVQQTFRDYQYPIPSVEKIKYYLQLPPELLMKKLTKEYFTSECLLQILISQYYYHYNEMEYDSLCLTPNIKETLKVLKSKKIKIHIMSNRGTKELEKILRKLEIQNLCDTATGKSDSFREYGDVLEHISNFYCTDNTKCLAVSNTKQGVDMGRRLSMKTCCISWGRLDVDSLAKNSPDILISQSQNISSKILAI